MAVQIFLSQLSLGPLALLPGAMRHCATLAAEAGFDGIEIPQFWCGRTKRPDKCRRLAQDFGLGLHFHEAWTLADDRSHLFSHGLNVLGFLPPEKSTLEEQFETVTEPVVVYPDRYFREKKWAQNYWVQTCCPSELREGELRFRMNPRVFGVMVTKARLPVVFDTQHYLEHQLNIGPGVEKFRLNSRSLNLVLEAGWTRLSHLVREIHLCNFDPGLGHLGGRNVALDKGVLNLRLFAELVKGGEWNGVVVPEIQAGHLGFGLATSFAKKCDILKRLRDQVGAMFE